MAKLTLSASDLIPLREPTFYILLTLAQGKKHGYAILQQVAALSSSRVRLSTGTLYGALGRLLTQGLIERAAEGTPDAREEGMEPDDGDGALSSTRQRKCYQLTPFGQRVLEAELARLQALLSIAQQQMGREPS